MSEQYDSMLLSSATVHDWSAQKPGGKPFYGYGYAPEVSEDDFYDVLSSNQFEDWLKRLDPRFELKHITIQNVQRNHKGDIRFICVEFTFRLRGEKEFTRKHFTFMRGGSVVMLNVIRTTEGNEYAILAEQARIATGIYAFPEIAAGTMEGCEAFLVQARRENQEELGLGEPDLCVDLTEAVYGDEFPGVFASAGGTDEYYRCFLMRYGMTSEELAAITGRLGGLATENEQIVARIVPLSGLVSACPDAKTIVAHSLYRTLLERGALC